MKLNIQFAAQLNGIGILTSHYPLFMFGDFSARSEFRTIISVWFRFMSFLLSCMTQITGKRSGFAYHKIGNGHIYKDQFELMKEVQLKRESLAIPQFKIHSEVNSLEALEALED